jgi:hypothetical protein
MALPFFDGAIEAAAAAAVAAPPQSWTTMKTLSALYSTKST